MSDVHGKHLKTISRTKQ